MASKIRISLNIPKIADELIEKKANDDITSLNDFSKLVNKAEKVKKAIKPKKNEQ